MLQPMTGRVLPFWLAEALLVMALPLLAIWPLGIASNPFDEKRLLEVTLLVIFAALFVVVKPLQAIWRAQLMSIPPLIIRVLVVMLLLGLISSLRAKVPAAALTEIALWVVLLSSLVAVAALRVRLGTHFDVTLTATFAFIFLVYLLVVSGYVAQAAAGIRDLDLRELFVNFSQVRFFNQFQSWTLPLAVVPALYAEKRGWRLVRNVLIAAAAGWWLLLLLSGGRGTLLAMVVCSAAVWLLFRQRVEAWLKWQLIALLGGVVFYLLITQLITVLTDGLVENPAMVRATLSGRGALWQLALKMIADHPLLGVGPMHYACAEPMLAGHPHNALLQIGAEWGIPVLLLLVGIIVWLGYAAVSACRRQSIDATEVDVAPLLMASLLSGAVHALLSGVIVMPISQVTLVVCGGWLWGGLSAAPAAPAAWRLRHTGWSIVLVVAGLMVMSTVWPLWRDVVSGSIPAPDKTRVYMPRFWIDGAICREDDSRWHLPLRGE